jgi:hypothetical protein
MQWDMPGLTEFRFSDGKKSLVKIEIATSQVHGFGNAQPRRGDQTEDCLIGNRPRRTRAR